MPGRSDALETEDMEQIRQECRQLLDAGVDTAQAKKMLSERWLRSMSRIREITQGIKPSFHRSPISIIEGQVTVESASIESKPKVTLPPQPVRSAEVPELPKFLKQEALPATNFGYVSHTELNLDAETIYEPTKPKAKTFIITGWEVRVKPDFAFLDCLRQIAKEYGAELFLTPHYLPDLDFLPPELRVNFKLLTDDLHFNSNLMFRFVETHALAVSPLSGWKGVSDKTQIIPGLIKQLETYPTDSHARQAVTTGSIGYLTLDSEHYKFISDSSDNAYKKRFSDRWNNFRSQKKTTAIASEFVRPSALLIHVIDDKRFLLRRLTMQPGNDYVYDLNKKYTANKRNPQTVRPSLDIGDTHAWFADPMAMRCTFEQIELLQPRHILTNDFFDGVSVNHHEKDRPFLFRQAPPIAVEIAYTQNLYALIKKKAPKDARCIDLHSNHSDFLEKFLDAGEKYWQQNYNYELLCDLQARRMKSDKHPIELLIDFPKVGFEFWPDREPFRIGKVACIHGHQPVNGRRTGFIELAKHYNFLSMDHIHSPKEFRNAVAGGMTGIRDMAYTDGSISGSLHANKIIHEDGSMQLLTMVDRLWICSGR